MLVLYFLHFNGAGKQCNFHTRAMQQVVKCYVDVFFLEFFTTFQPGPSLLQVVCYQCKAGINIRKLQTDIHRKLATLYSRIQPFKEIVQNMQPSVAHLSKGMQVVLNFQQLLCVSYFVLKLISIYEW